MDSLEITTLDIAKFFYTEDIGIKKRRLIIYGLWEKREEYLECFMYDSFKIFSNEIDNLLMDIAFDNLLYYEMEEIMELQKDTDFDYAGYGLYKLNKHRTEDFLKQCRLKIMYTSNKDYIYMKMRTLAKHCGYKRRSEKFVREVEETLEELELYLYDGYYRIGKESIIPGEYIRKITDVGMDEFIRIYHY